MSVCVWVCVCFVCVCVCVCVRKANVGTATRFSKFWKQQYTSSMDTYLPSHKLFK